MTTRCIGEPVSWLRLEQIALGTSDSEADGHLAQCSACRDAFAAIESDGRQLRALRLPAVEPSGRRWLRWAVIGSFAAVAVAVMLVVLVSNETDAPRTALRAAIPIKGGGELVVSLVRERGGQIDSEPTSIRDGDRFKVVLTCSEPGPFVGAITVEQGGEVYRPLGETTELHCGNRTFVPGAFTATGNEPFTVCVRPSGSDAVACVGL